MAYDALTDRHSPLKATKAYLSILQLAAKESESAVDEALRHLFDRDQAISAETVKQQVLCGHKPAPVTAISLPAVSLQSYDSLLGERGVTA